MVPAFHWTLCVALISPGGEDPVEDGVPTAASDKKEQGPSKKVPVLPLVRVTLEGDPTYGAVLETDPKSGVHIILANGSLLEIDEDVFARGEEVGTQVVTALSPDALVEGLAHPDRWVRDHCLVILKVQGKRAHRAIEPALKHEEDEVRWRALEVLVEHPDDKFRSKIRRCLRSTHQRVRKSALRAYGLLETDDLLELCEDVLRWDKSPWVVHEAITQLGKAGTLQAIDPLLKHLENCEERALRVYTFSWLRRLTGQDLGRDADAWQSWWTNRRDALLEAERIARLEQEAAESWPWDD